MQNKFQAHANRVARAKALLQKGEADLKKAQKKFYADCDKFFGQGSYVIYESRAPHPKMRLARQISQPRNIDSKKVKELLDADMWLQVSYQPVVDRQFDLKSFDAAVAAGKISKEIVDAVTSYGNVPHLIWTATTDNTKYPLEAGQMATVALGEPVATQEA